VLKVVTPTVQVDAQLPVGRAASIKVKLQAKELRKMEEEFGQV
jgi:hypothetical protein